MSELPNQPPTPDEHRDRLLDQALAEAHGRETPPDLSAQILSHTAASASPLQRLGANQTIPHQSPGRLWPSLALAAALLIAASTLIFPSVFTTREAARRTQVTNNEKQIADNVFSDSAGKPTAPMPGEATSNAEQVVLRQLQRQKAGRPSPYYADDALARSRWGTPAPGDDPTAAPIDALGRALPRKPRYSRENQVELGTIIQEKAVERLGVELDVAGKPITETFAWQVRRDPLQQGGLGAGQTGDRYARIEENPFKAVSAANTDNRLSTFSIDVDTASYANVRQYLLGEQTLPPPDAVRIEELVNYFQYDYSPPTGDVPFAAHVETAACPWNGEHRLARVAIKGREMDRAKRPKSNLVFLIDVSGSMDEPAKLPLLVEGMRMLTRELGENDRVSIVVYAGSEGLALPSTPGTDQPTILAALDKLSAGGSTAGGAGIALAYKIAKENFIAGATNRVILCTDGDFNVGVTSTADLERMAETQAKETGVFLTVLGFGRGNLNDEMMERIADKGNGNYHYVDGRSEARKVLVEEMTGTLVTIAKDVKIQVEFNPAQVAGYRLIGYENRVLAAEDFNDDKKDAGEIGAGHTVTALYEIIPAGQKVEAGDVDDLKYGGPAPSGEPASAERAPTESSPSPSPELLTLKIRYKTPDGDKSTKLEFPITDNGQPFAKASQDFQFASAVASFGMLLRQSEFKGNATYAAVAEIAEAASKDRDPHGYRKEFVEMVAKAKELAGE